MKQVAVLFLFPFLMTQVWAAPTYTGVKDFLERNADYQNYVEITEAVYKAKCGECLFDKTHFQSPIRKTIRADFNFDGLLDYAAVVAKSLGEPSKEGVFFDHTLIILMAHYNGDNYTLNATNKGFLNENAWPGDHENAWPGDQENELNNESFVNFNKYTKTLSLNENYWGYATYLRPSGLKSYVLRYSGGASKMLVAEYRYTDSWPFESGESSSVDHVVNFATQTFTSIRPTFDLENPGCFSAKGKISFSRNNKKTQYPLVEEVSFVGKEENSILKRVIEEDVVKGKDCSFL